MTPRGMAPSGRHCLQWRLLFTVVVGAVLFSAAAGALAWRIGQARALSSTMAALESLAQAVQQTLSVGAYAGDPVLLKEVVDGLALNELVAGVEVRSVTDKVLAEHWNGSKLTSARPAALSSAAAARTPLSVARPLVSPFDNKELVGVLYLHADTAGVAAAERREAYLLGALMVGQAALMALLLYAVVARLVTGPIVSLAQSLHAMSPGTDVRLALPQRHRGDEIGVLIGSANALLEANAEALHTERMLRAEIEVMEAQYRQIFDSSGAGIFVLDQHGRMINSNPTVSRVVGLSRDDLRRLKQDRFVQRVFAHPQQVESMVDNARRRGETVSGDLELVQQGHGTRWVHCLISVQGQTPAAPVYSSSEAAGTGEPSEMVEGVIYDITERKSAETAVRHAAEHDTLTGLKNRRASEALIDRFVADALVSGSPMSLLCIDLDGFKQVNDLLGHAAGDQVLQACAQRMKAAVRRSTDVAGRMGGDEFVVALYNIGPADPALCQVAEALVHGLSQPVVIDGGAHASVGASIGIACLPVHGCDRIQLTAAADAAMYEVKRNGKNGWVMASGVAGAADRSTSFAPPTRATPALPVTLTDLTAPVHRAAASA